MSRFVSKRGQHYAAKPPVEVPADYDVLLQAAVNVPGTVRAAYSAFHNYSMANQALAMFQFSARGMLPEPVGTYKAWLALGRQVRSGEHASIIMWRPFTFKRKQKDGETEERGGGTGFTCRRQWFSLSQTDGDTEPKFPDLGEWDVERAIIGVGLSREPFMEVNGNIQGYSHGKKIAVSPLAPEPVGVAVHEMAHGLLHQNNVPELIIDRGEFDKSLREAEAECTRYLVLEALGIDDAANCRGYIQNWWGLGNPIPKDSARRIFTAANRILKAGYAIPVAEPAEDAEAEDETAELRLAA